MDKNQTIKFLQDFWVCVVSQEKDALSHYFQESAVIRWHATNEEFTLEEYLIANCEYPGDWDVEIIEVFGEYNHYITVVKVFSDDLSCFVTSIFQLKDDRIISLDEYYADVANPPEWRQQMKLGRII